MKAFLDTSSLFKKYFEEEGSAELEELLQSVSTVTVAPITILETNSIIERRLRDKSLTSEDAKWIEKELSFDYNFYGIVDFNENLTKETLRVIRKYQMKVLDGIQLGAAIISTPDIFVVSDKKLYSSAKRELKKTILI